MQAQSKSTWRASPPAMALDDCSFCHGTGWQLLSSAGSSRARRCSCAALQRKMLLIEQIHIPPRYDHCTLGNFEPATVSQARALGEVQRLVDRFPRVEHDLFLTGDPGVGKTHLSVAALLELLQRFHDDLLFTDSSALLDIQSIGPQSAAEGCQRMKTASLLVLDDLNPALLNDGLWTFLNEVHSSRRRAGKPTIVTAGRIMSGKAAADPGKNVNGNIVTYPSRFQRRFLMQWMSCARTVVMCGEDRRHCPASLF